MNSRKTIFSQRRIPNYRLSFGSKTEFHPRKAEMYNFKSMKTALAAIITASTCIAASCVVAKPNMYANFPVTEKSLQKVVRQTRYLTQDKQQDMFFTPL